VLFKGEGDESPKIKRNETCCERDVKFDVEKFKFLGG